MREPQPIAGARVPLFDRLDLNPEIDDEQRPFRILTQAQNGGTGAVTRVLVESRDTETGDRWTTVGVSPNIIDASFEALLDSINYKLLKENAVAATAG